jgi:ABC-type polar amino acid transport system ATPase subunit
MISIEGVNKWYGAHHALRDIDLQVARGEVIVLCGPSGSGKSTLLRTINRLEAVQQGVIRVDGVTVTDASINLNRLRQDIGFVFQSFNLYPNMTVLRNLTLAPTKVLGLSRQQAEQRAKDLLVRVGLLDKMANYPSQLSGGQQQRVAIARALAMAPKIMLFDEPTSALDPELISEVLDVMTDLARDRMTMVVVTHEMAFAQRVADRMVFMSEGRIVEEGHAAAFFNRPREPRTRQFLDKILSHAPVVNSGPDGVSESCLA